MKDLVHPDEGLLIQYLDGELPESEFVKLRSHLVSCLVCRQKQDRLARVSAGLEALIARQPVQPSPDSRNNLARAMASGSRFETVKHSPGRVMRRFAWGMAVAATLAIGILLAPRSTRIPEHASTAHPSTALPSIDVNGESFISLPYSNPDLPLNAPRIIEMRVPVSSLASAGIVLEPVASESDDRTVLANVLLGMDGQPMGVHVLSPESE